MVNLLNPGNDPIVDERLRRGLLNFGTALVTGGPGVPGDIAQGAGNAVTGLLNARMGSIDPTGRVRAMSGQYGLLRPPEVPFSSEAMQKGLGGDPNAPESLLGFVGAPDVTDVGKVVAAAAAKGLLDPALAMTLFHGTPHKFDMFDLEKIGTGEGAQAYGHGLYFAENPGVANSYKYDLSRDINSLKATDRAHVAASKSFKDANYSLDDARKGMREAYPGISDDQLEAALNESYNHAGHLYEVDIPDETIGKMLDWDAPLSEQPEYVRDILTAWQKKVGGSISDGEGALKEIAFQRRMDGLDDSPAAVSQQLKEMGIPGIRYYDGASRGKAGIGQTIGQREKKLLNDMVAAEEAGNTALVAKLQKQLDNLEDDVQGTRNIVVFDPNDIRQVKRDGELVYKTKGL